MSFTNILNNILSTKKRGVLSINDSVFDKFKYMSYYSNPLKDCTYYPKPIKFSTMSDDIANRNNLLDSNEWDCYEYTLEYLIHRYEPTHMKAIKYRSTILR